MRPSSCSLVLALAVAVGITSQVTAGEPVIVLSDEAVDLAAVRAGIAAERADPRSSEPGPGSIAVPSTFSSSNPWYVPFVVDTGNPTGTTTLLAVRNDTDPGQTFDIGLEFVDSTGFEFDQEIVSLPAHGVVTVNLRDRAGLPGGVARGYVRVTPDLGQQISVDYFVITPGEAFASGGMAIDLDQDMCRVWKVRVLIGGPFTGGTRFRILVDGPRGEDPADPPTVFGSVYDESGTLINSFTVRTDEYVLELDAADLVLPDSLFGSIEMVLDGEFGGGYVINEVSADGQYTVGFPGACPPQVL